MFDDLTRKPVNLNFKSNIIRIFPKLFNFSDQQKFVVNKLDLTVKDGKELLAKFKSNSLIPVTNVYNITIWRVDLIEEDYTDTKISYRITNSIYISHREGFGLITITDKKGQAIPFMYNALFS